MANNIQYSEQVAINSICAVSNPISSHHEAALNTANGSAGKTWQQMLNVNAGSVNPIAKSPQELLYNKVKTTLGLTDPYTLYSEQVLLNLAKANGTITALNLVNK